MKLFLATSALLIGLSIPARASTGYGGFNAVLSLFGVTHQKNTSPNGEEIQTEDSIGQIRMGWSHGEDEADIGIIAEAQREIQRSSNAAPTTEEMASGLSIGFKDNGSYILLHYFIKAQHLAENSERLDGNGFGVDIGHHYRLNSVFSIGVDLTYRRFRFKSSQQEIEHSRIAPLVGLGITF